MEVKDTEFVYYHSELHGEKELIPDYIRHCIDVVKVFTYKNHEMTALFQTGGGIIQNNHNCPSPELELYANESHPIIAMLDQMYEADLNEEVWIEDKINEMNEEIPDFVNSFEELQNLYFFYRDEIPKINQICHERDLSNDIEDYDIDVSRIATRKK